MLFEIKIGGRGKMHRYSEIRMFIKSQKQTYSMVPYALYWLQHLVGHKLLENDGR